MNERLYNVLSHYDIPLRIALGVDLRVVLTWDLDMTDLELHVTEPNGERCHSFHNHTTNGLYLDHFFFKYFHFVKLTFARWYVDKGYGKRTRTRSISDQESCSWSLQNSSEALQCPRPHCDVRVICKPN